MAEERRIAPLPSAKSREAMRRTRYCYLEQLPPELIRQVFDHAELRVTQVPLSKKLLPFTLEALYHNVQIFSRKMLVRFAASIRAQPQLAGAVKVFGVSGRDDELEEDDSGEESDDSGDSEWTTDYSSGFEVDDTESDESLCDVEAERASLDLADSMNLGMGGLCLDSQPDPYEPERLVADDALLRDLLRRLTSLESLLVFGRDRLHTVFDESFLREGVLPTVKVFTFAITTGEDFEEFGSDPATCRRLQLLPSPEHVEFMGNLEGMPMDLTNTLPRYRLEPRSWALRVFALHEWHWVGEEIKHLFAAVKPGFQILKIQALACYEGLPDDMAALLPNTIEVLEVEFGSTCWCYDGGALPSFDLVFERLPLLRHLHLGGPLLSTSTIPSLGDLPNLHCLTFSYHLPLVGAALLHICMCPDPFGGGSRRRRPRWHPSFGYSEARSVVRAAEKAGIEIGGNLLCAVKRCDKGDGHACTRV